MTYPASYILGTFNAHCACGWRGMCEVKEGKLKDMPCPECGGTLMSGIFIKAALAFL
jgi:hypothetical protein